VLLLGAGCAPEPDAPSAHAPAGAEGPPAEPAPLLRYAVDTSTPLTLLESLLTAAKRAREAQARSARVSWNTVAELLDRVSGDSPYAERLRRACPRLDDTAPFAALRWTVLGERALPPGAEGAERRRLFFVLQGYGIAMETPFPIGVLPRAALRLPVWVLRQLVPSGAPHPVRPRFGECVRGAARPRTWLLAVEVQRTPDGWRFAGDTIWIEGLLLSTEVA
jgi:hypothetical protein